MADRFEDLRIFVSVVQGEGFNTAAKKLGIAKSAVSRRMRDLEDRLGVRLINRTTRMISLSDAGREFYDRSLKLLADLKEAEDLAATGAQAAVGRLRISAPVSLSVHCLAPVIGAFMSQHPNLHVDVMVSDRLVDIVADGFDLAIRVSVLKDSSLIARRIGTVRRVAVASPAYLDANGRPQTPEDLSAHFGIAYSNVDPRTYWTFADGVIAQPEVRLTFDNGDALREAAIAGYGIVLLPTFIAHWAIERGDLEVILPHHMRAPMAMSVVYPSNRNVSAKVRLFIDHLAASFGGEPFWDRKLIASGIIPPSR